MAATREAVLTALRELSLPDGGDPVTADLVRALTVEGESVRFVLEAADAETAKRLEPVRAAAEERVQALPGVGRVSVALTAPSPKSPPPDIKGGGAKIGRHPTGQSGPQDVAGIDRILAVASGKGGVGKSTVSANLAVALARAGRRVGLLDADFYGPSQPSMMGVTKRPGSPDGERIIPLQAHGVTVMSIGLMLEEGQAVVWRGPMLMGALQQMMGQVEWGELDVLIVDLPPGTGDVQLTLSQKFTVGGALIVSTPQDVALMDVRKAIAMFDKLGTPIRGLIENMGVYVCPQCGHEAHIFGSGGVAAEAERIGAPLLGSLPLSLAVREAGDSGRPVAAGDGPEAAAYTALARRLVDDGIA